jgi:hypothetical protein
MPRGDGGPSAEVLAADGDEVRVLGEGRGERRPVHSVPPAFEPGDDALERGALGWR